MEEKLERLKPLIWGAVNWHNPEAALAPLLKVYCSVLAQFDSQSSNQISHQSSSHETSAHTNISQLSYVGKLVI